MTTFASGDTPTAQDLTDATRQGILARGRRTTSTATTTTELSVLRLDGIPMRAGRLCRIWTPPLAAGSSNAGDNAFVRIRYSTSGAATISSPILITAVGYSGTLASTVQVLVAKYTPPSDQTVSILLTVGRWAGTGNCSITVNANTPEIELVVEDTGGDPGDTGIVL